MIEIRFERDRAARRIVRPLVKMALVAALAFTPAHAAFAEDAEVEAEASETEVAVETTAVGEPMPCAELAQQRYPFLTCVRGASGEPVFATQGPGLTGARLKIKSGYVDGAGGWGDSGLE